MGKEGLEEILQQFSFSSAPPHLSGEHILIEHVPQTLPRSVVPRRRSVVPERRVVGRQGVRKREFLHVLYLLLWAPHELTVEGLHVGYSGGYVTPIFGGLKGKYPSVEEVVRVIDAIRLMIVVVA